MSRIIFMITGLLVFCLAAQLSLAAQDMRQMQVEAREKRQQLLKQARQEKKAAEQEAAQARQRIISDREALLQAVSDLEAENEKYADSIAALEKDVQDLTAEESALSAELKEAQNTVQDLRRAIQASAQDVQDLQQDSLQSAADTEKKEILTGIVQEEGFPGMQDIRVLADILQEEIQLSGAVRLQEGSIVDRSGEEVTAELLFLGNFTAAYRTPEEVGFLQPSPDGKQLFALPNLPAWRMQNQLNSYMDGESQAVPLDISRGGALRQLTHKLNFQEQISQGGPLVWPILFLLALGLAIILERIIFLLRKRFDSRGFMFSVQKLLEQGNFEKCRQACSQQGHKPLPRIISAGLSCCHMPREEMENALQEAILREIPPMERFLSTLGMLAAIAPLLGLLGTVTGMINTFQVITLHGTGDPRMMSGGISEALMTTMLGLSVAIPMLMAHTWLNRAMEKKIEDMEEKAVALVNMAHKGKRQAEHMHAQGHEG